MKSHRPFRLSVSCAAALAVALLAASAASAGPAPQTAAGDLLDPRTYAPASKLFLVLHATGVQRYVCAANATWTFTDPVAELFTTTGTAKPGGSHFLNFATGRPVWQAKDGSSVEAARRQTLAAGAPRGAGSLVFATELSAPGAELCVLLVLAPDA